MKGHTAQGSDAVKNNNFLNAGGSAQLNPGSIARCIVIHRTLAADGENAAFIQCPGNRDSAVTAERECHLRVWSSRRSGRCTTLRGTVSLGGSPAPAGCAVAAARAGAAVTGTGTTAAVCFAPSVAGTALTVTIAGGTLHPFGTAGRIAIAAAVTGAGKTFAVTQAAGAPGGSCTGAAETVAAAQTALAITITAAGAAGNHSRSRTLRRTGGIGRAGIRSSGNGNAQ